MIKINKNQASIYIQKVFRGYLSRKNDTDYYLMKNVKYYKA